MAWVDCMRLRRVATIVRIVGWVMAAVSFCIAVVETFANEATESVLLFVIFAGIALGVLGVAHLVAWVIDKRGDRLVTR